VAEKILIADDDADIIRFVEVNLLLEGFEVLTATDGREAFETAIKEVPELVLLDVMMPKMDGYEVCQRLRADGRTRNIGIIMLTAKTLSADRVVGLTAGADDYIGKPFDPIELVARVKAQLRRARDLRAVSPLTGLPGNTQIEQEIQRRLAAGESVSVIYADLDNFKAYNDRYGYLRGDEAIVRTARVLQQAFNQCEGCFLGHIGGDDFVCVGSPATLDEIEEQCRQIVASFDSQARSLYETNDAEAGFIEVHDRRGNIVRYPLITISIGVAHNLLHPVADHHQLVEIATEMKNYAKRSDRSGYAIDRRSE
jgi:diguanylate cyclase (GGDEF)-like protein